jgi:surface protein
MLVALLAACGQRVGEISIFPTEVTLKPKATQEFTATVRGVSNAAIRWSQSCGEISGTGSTVSYTAPAVSGECTVTASTVGQQEQQASATVTVVSGIVVTLSPPQVTLIPGQTQAFVAEVTGADDSAVRWSASCGVISGTGLTVSYTAPESGETCSVVVASAVDPAVSATATVNLLPPPMILSIDTRLAEGTTVTLPLRGEVAVTVDWGDGTVVMAETEGDLEHSYAAEGSYTIRMSGSVTQFGDPFYANAEKLTEVASWGELGLVSLSGAFSNAVNLTALPAQLPETVRDTSFMFFFATAFNVDISSWDVGQVETMRYMFFEASAFNQDISGWNVGRVTDMSGMFYGAAAFNQDIGGWDVSQVTNMNEMFERASAFNQDLSGWDVSNVTTMTGMFERAEAFNQPIGAWEVSGVTAMERMFERASAFNQDIGAWNVGNVTTMERMFEDASAFNQDISGWDVRQVVNMDYMFFRAEAFNQDLSSWCVGAIPVAPMRFDDEATAWTAPRPIWGSCPGD